MRSLVGEIPFALAFGSEAVTPIEISLASLRTQLLQTEQAKRELRLNLDLIEERRTEASLRMATYQQRIMKYYNARV